MKTAPRLILAGLLLLATSYAFAQADDKTWSSVGCRGYGLTTPDSNMTFQTSGIYNPQSTYQTVICPIEMDQEGGWGTTVGTDAVDINVSFRIGPVATKTGCTLYRTSGTTTSAIGGYTAPSNYTPNSLHSISFHNTAVTSDGQGLALVCTMGPKVAMTAINIQEWKETGPTLP